MRASLALIVPALIVLALAGLPLAGCAGLPQVRFATAPYDPGYAAFLAGSGHVNPEDPGLPNGGGG